MSDIQSTDLIELKAKQLSGAIATAEGFFAPDSLPARCHNPGDLELGDKGFGVDNGKTIYENDDVGWAALNHQCLMMLSSGSHVYTINDTFAEVALKWTGNDNPEAWSKIVCTKLGIDEGITLHEFVVG